MQTAVPSVLLSSRLLISRMRLSCASLLLFAVSACFGATDIVRYEVLKSFGSTTNEGAAPVAQLIEGSDGALYGTTDWLGPTNYFRGTVFKLKKDGADYTVLHVFHGSPNDGNLPWFSGVIQASDGLLYGTTCWGGAYDEGIVFKMRRDGSDFTILHHFGGTVSDGRHPAAGVIEANDGVLYGTTQVGGSPAYTGIGGGTVFAINKDGSDYRILHRFGWPQPVDGGDPMGKLLQASDGALYGTTLAGAVFRLNTDGSRFTNVIVFDAGPNVFINLYAGVMEGSDGALYGSGNLGLFKVNKDGSGYRFLRGFYETLTAGILVKGRDHALYGVADRGDSGPDYYGYVFKIQEDGSGYRVLHTFGLSTNDGQYPLGGGLLLGSDGAFYGTTINGGEHRGGTLFRLLANHAPVAQCVVPIVSADSNCMAAASIDSHSYDPDGDAIVISQVPPGPYPLGTNHVSLVVTDSYGDSNLCDSSVIVLDTTPPALACPSNITTEFTSAAGASVAYSITAADFCDPAPALIGVPSSGSTFPIGASVVHCIAFDSGGNSNLCSFTVTVQGARGVKQNVLADLISIQASFESDTVPQKLSEAVAHLARSLEPSLWIDETHIEGLTGQTVFLEDVQAVRNLCELMRSPNNTIAPAALQSLISRIFRADRLLASVAVDEAISTGQPPRKIMQAQRFLASGDASADRDLCGAAIQQYSLAWLRAFVP